jgi:hypothetical protein
MEKKWDNNEKLHQLFINFKKVYDSIKREVFYNILIEFGVPTKLGRVIKMCLNKTYSKALICKHLSDNFPIRNGLKEGHVLSPLLFNFSLEYAIRKIQENRVGLKLNWTHQLLVYGDDVNLMGDNTGTIKRNTETITDAIKKFGLQVNAGKTMYMLLPRRQNAGEYLNIKTANIFLKVWHSSNIWERQYQIKI